MRVIIGRGSDKDKSDVYIFYQELINFPESVTLQSHLAHWHAGGDFDLNEVKNIGSKFLFSCEALKLRAFNKTDSFNF